MSLPQTAEDPREREAKRLRLQEATLESLLQQHQLRNPLLDMNSMESQNPSDFPQILNQLKNSYRMSGNGPSQTNINILTSPLNSSNPESDGKINELLKKLGIMEQSASHEEMLESLRLANANLKKDNDKKEYMIQDLLKKLHDALETIKLQTAQINELQMHHGVPPQMNQHHQQQMHHQSTNLMNMMETSAHFTQSQLMAATSSPQMMPHHSPSPQMLHHQQHPQSASPQMMHSGSPSPLMMHHHHHQTNSPVMSHHASEENMFKMTPQMTRRGDSQLELRVLQQPPNQAVYQRILRPFPTVAVVGVSSLGQGSANNLFVEVSLLKQDEHDAQAFYQGMYALKPNSPLEEKKNLIGGQLVQRSEVGSSPDSLVVVFRKLKILTTTAQQGGAFFLLKFVLKKYVDNQFETVPNVACAISDPIEVFSHTLYLKGRPKTNSPSPRTAKRNANRTVKTEIPTENAAAAVAAATALMNARSNSNGSNQSPANQSIGSPMLSSSSDASIPHHGEDLSSLVAVSVGSD